MALFPGFFGYNYLFWLSMSLARFFSEEIPAYLKAKIGRLAPPPAQRLQINDIAVIMAAHNEEIALAATLAALKKNLPAQQIYIGSDASTDQTVAIAFANGCNIADLQPNRGKAKTLASLLHHFKILDRYKAVLIVDADIVVSDTYLEKILPYFDDPKVAAFVSHATSRWQSHGWPKWSMLFPAYRPRLWLPLYYGLRYGQTWKYVCATPIVPGGSSIYRTTALKQIEIDTPGLIIEDFHMTFQIYHKKLGRIASHPSAYIIDQEPYSLRDYCRQVYRWFLGFWQTFFLHGFWASFFWFATAAFTLEMIISSIIILTLPFILGAILFTPFANFAIIHITIAPLGIEHAPVTVFGLLFGMLIMDYFVTVLATVITRKPILLVYGLGFYFLRYIDTIIFLYTLPLALLSKTATGIWQSPKRKGLTVT